MGKIEEQQGKKYLMVADYMLNKVLGKIKETLSVGKFDDTKTLIDPDDKLPNDIALRKAVILMTCVIKDGNKFYPRIFLDHALYDE